MSLCYPCVCVCVCVLVAPSPRLAVEFNDSLKDGECDDDFDDDEQHCLLSPK